MFNKQESTAVIHTSRNSIYSVIGGLSLIEKIVNKIILITTLFLMAYLLYRSYNLGVFKGESLILENAISGNNTSWRGYTQLLNLLLLFDLVLILIISVIETIKGNYNKVLKKVLGFVALVLLVNFSYLLSEYLARLAYILFGLEKIISTGIY